MSLHAVPIEYNISWKDPASHVLQVRILADVSQGEYTDFSIPVWRPGRYTLEHYAAGISAFEAQSLSGKPFEWKKINTDTWRVFHEESSRLVVTYQFYAVGIDAGSTYLGKDQLFINPVNVCMFIPGRLEDPVGLFFPEVSPNWDIVSAMPRGGATSSFFPDDYHQLVDNPVLLAKEIKTLEFELEGATFYLHFHGDYRGGIRTDQEAIHVIKQICSEAHKIFGSFPFESYHFIYRLLPYDIRHAVEHANCASFALPARISESPTKMSSGIGGISAHEFWHVWNVKRIRPTALLPYDYSQPQYTGLHWFTEGVTNYYADLLLVRSGIIEVKTFFSRQANAIQGVENHGARKRISPTQASMDSWAGGAYYHPPGGFPSYYTLGQRIGFILDIAIQRYTDGSKNLDDLFRYLNEHYGGLKKGLDEDGIQKALEEISGKNWSDFFQNYIHQTEPIPYEDYLDWMGLRLQMKEVERLSTKKLGLESYQKTGQGILIREVQPGSLFAKEHLMKGDVILEWNDKPAASFDIEAFCRGLSSGEDFTVKVFSDFELKSLKLNYKKPFNEWKVSITRDPDKQEQQNQRLHPWLDISL